MAQIFESEMRLQFDEQLKRVRCWQDDLEADVSFLKQAKALATKLGKHGVEGAADFEGIVGKQCADLQTYVVDQLVDRTRAEERLKAVSDAIDSSNADAPINGMATDQGLLGIVEDIEKDIVYLGTVHDQVCGLQARGIAIPTEAIDAIDAQKKETEKSVQEELEVLTQLADRLQATASRIDVEDVDDAQEV